MNNPGRVKACFDALLFINQRGRWVDFTNGDTHSCQVQLVETDSGGTNYVQLCCRKDGKVHRHLNILINNDH